MDSFKVREGNSEVIVFLDHHYSSDTEAIQEASKILKREVIYRELNPSKFAPWKSASDELSQRSRTDGL